MYYFHTRRLHTACRNGWHNYVPLIWVFFNSYVCISDVAVCEMTTCNTWGLEEAPKKHMELFRSLQIYIYIYISMSRNDMCKWRWWTRHKEINYLFTSQAATISLTYGKVAHLNPVVNLCNVCFDIKYLSLCHSIVLRKEKYYFHKCFCNGDAVFSRSSRNWNF